MAVPDETLKHLLESLLEGTEKLETVQAAITSLILDTNVSATDESVRIDLDRLRRCGYPEVIYAPGKTDSALFAGLTALIQAEQNCLVTRCSPAQGSFLREKFAESIYDEQARTVRLNRESPLRGKVCVVTAGTSDRPVALEALETLRWMNVEAEILLDVGVAGPQRFLNVKHQIAECDAVVVVAGMEGALPSVVGGWLDCPVIAVPTSVGYGAAFGGVAALLGMLNSCAANVAVVNIDAGFKGGYLAGMIARGRNLDDQAAEHSKEYSNENPL